MPTQDLVSYFKSLSESRFIGIKNTLSEVSRKALWSSTCHFQVPHFRSTIPTNGSEKRIRLSVEYNWQLWTALKVSNVQSFMTSKWWLIGFKYRGINRILDYHVQALSHSDSGFILNTALAILFGAQSCADRKLDVTDQEKLHMIGQRMVMVDVW